MKQLFVSMIVVMACVALKGQPGTGQIFAGGSIGFYGSGQKFKDGDTITTEQSAASIEFLPMAGYFLSDKLVVGVKTGISSSVSKYPNDNPEKRSTFMFIIAPFGRYYVVTGTGGIFAEVSLEFGLGKRKTYNTGGTVETNLSSISAGISPGVYYYITPKISLEAKFGWAGFSSQLEKKDDQKFVQQNGGLNLYPSNISLGVLFVL